jgi:hypothetical protein
MKLRPPSLKDSEVVWAELRGWRGVSMGVAFGTVCGGLLNLSLVDAWIFWAAVAASAAAQLLAMWRMMRCVRRLKRWEDERDAWSN